MKILAKIDEAKDIASKEYIDNLMQSLDSTYQPLISNSNKLAYSLISGTPTIPTSLKSPYALSWSGYSSGSYDGSAAKSITIPSNTNQLTNGAGFITSSALSSYLPLSGGTISGSYGALIIKRNSSSGVSTVRFTNADGTLGMIGMNTDYEPIVYKGSSESNPNIIIHSANYSSYALPLSGGTITGNLFLKNTYFMWQETTNNYGGYFTGQAFNAHTNQGYTAQIFTWGTDGILTFKSTPKVGSNTIWHSGNDGSGSGLDADMLDGVQLNGLFTSVSSSANTNLSITVGGTTKSITSIYADFAKCFYSPWNNPTSGTFDLNTHYGGGMVRYYGSGGSLTNAPSGFGYGNILSLSTGIASLSGQLAWNINHASTTDTTKALYWRAADSTNGYAYAKWHQIAFTDSNVASATKLQTARSIWGQSFDGTGNVNGKLMLTSWDSNGVAIRLENSSAGNALISTYSYASNAYDFGQKSNRFIINHNTYGEVFSIANGNVGIGTTSPKGKFHVEGNSYLRGTIYVTNPDATTINESSGKIKFNSINADDSYRSPYIQAIYYSSYARKRLGFFQSNAANYTDDFVEVLSILPNGNVGIGTASPATRLYIYQSGWDNGLTLDRSAAGSGAGIVVRTQGTPIGVFGLNGNRVYEFNVMKSGATAYTSCLTIDQNGNGLFYGGITSYSDIRKKTKLGDVQLTLKQIADAPLIEHYYKHDDKKTTHVGSIAQYWAGMNDWFCKLDSEGYYTMEIQNAALASAISIARELVKYESKTDRTIRLLKKRINQLEDEIEILKKGA